VGKTGLILCPYVSQSHPNLVSGAAARGASSSGRRLTQPPDIVTLIKPSRRRSSWSASALTCRWLFPQRPQIQCTHPKGHVSMISTKSSAKLSSNDSTIFINCWLGQYGDWDDTLHAVLWFYAVMVSLVFGACVRNIGRASRVGRSRQNPSAGSLNAGQSDEYRRSGSHWSAVRVERLLRWVLPSRGSRGVASSFLPRTPSLALRGPWCTFATIERFLEAEVEHSNRTPANRGSPLDPTQLDRVRLVAISGGDPSTRGEARMNPAGQPNKRLDQTAACVSVRSTECGCEAEVSSTDSSGEYSQRKSQRKYVTAQVL
jgi:hypothetical protein